MKQIYKNTENQSKLKILENTPKIILFKKNETTFSRRLLLHLSYVMFTVVVILSGTRKSIGQTCTASYSYLESGMYFARLMINGSEPVTKKFIKD